MLDRTAGLVTGHPVVVLVLLAVAALGLGWANGLVGPQADSTAFLPDDSDAANALAVLEEEFPDTAGAVGIDVLHRGDVLTSDGLAQLEAVLDAALAVDGVQERLVDENGVLSLVPVYEQALQTDDLSSVPQAQLDQVTAALMGDPNVAPLFDTLLGEADGEPLALTRLRLAPLDDTDDAVVAEIELAVADAVAAVDGPQDVRSL